MNNKDQPKYIGALYCPQIIPKYSGILVLPENMNLPTDEDQEEFVEELMESMGEPIDADEVDDSRLDCVRDFVKAYKSK